MDLLKLAAPVEADVKEWRHHLHRHPELSGHEEQTAAFVEKVLRDIGVDEVRRAGKYNVIALVRGAHPGPIVGLRADMDALPVSEESGVDFASENPGVMHACGHDAHTAMLLGAAKVLCTMRSELHGTVKFFFQTAEEILGGAKEIIEAGEVTEKDPPVCMAGLHVNPNRPAGTIAVRRGASSASSNGMEITITGRQGHGAHPDQCIDPIPAAAQVISSLQQLVSRQLAPADSAVVTIGTIHGGLKSNIIAPEVKMTGTIRTIKPQVQKDLFEAIPRVVKLTAEALRCKGEVTIKIGTPVLMNDDATFDRYLGVAEQVFGKENITWLENCSMGGEDFAFYTEKVPGTMFRLGTGFAGQKNAPLHSPLFKADESAFVYGVAMHVGFALDVCKG
ncbi:MAG: amidohydrolase [Pyramidobacter sp.]|nr:amidohydrolase [Pyramidobacter sp.]